MSWNMYKSYYRKFIKSEVGITKKLLAIFLLLSLAYPLFGQVKDNKPNYGYKLLPLVREDLPVEKYYHPAKRLAKSEDLAVVDFTSLMPPVVDQGQQGSCMAFSLTYALAYLNNKKFGYSLDHQYSQAFIYNLSAESLTSGLYNFWAYGVLMEAGIVKSSQFPYNQSDCSLLPSLSLRKEALKNRIAGWSWFYAGDTLPRPSPRV